MRIIPFSDILTMLGNRGCCDRVVAHLQHKLVGIDEEVQHATPTYRGLHNSI